jgi:hypothetical protein
VAIPVGSPSIPVPTSDPPSLVQALLAVKANIEIAQGFPHSRPVTTPTLVNTQLGAAIRAVT